MINISENVTDFYVSTVWNRETKFFPYGPLPLQSSTEGNLIIEKK
jgi:hypothetical protein